ncbi:glycosyltransferase [Caldicellulosiruptoraceae bacterium PP1]
MKSLILTINAGGGHLSAANAIKKAIQNRNFENKVLIVDALKLINPILDKLAIGTYLKAIKTVPFIYGLMYDSTEKGPPKKLNNVIYEKFYFVFYKLLNIINDFEPDIIIGTHPSPVDMVCELKKRGKIGTPVISVVTDFTIHPFWINPLVDYYVVHHENLVYEAILRGAEKDKILTFGIPISPLFVENNDTENLNNKNILVMGGSLGLGKIDKIVDIILKNNTQYNIIVVTGNNKILKDMISQRYEKYTDKIIVLGFVDYIYQLMSISSLLITKPGGLTCAEALSKNLPMFLFSPIPGQEERNTFYLVNNGAAVYSESLEQFDITFNQIINNNERLAQMKNSCKFLSKPNSAYDIADFLAKIV